MCFNPPDFKELLVYKILEFMGYMPKTHFFFDKPLPGRKGAPYGFYIATQDAAFTKTDAEKSFVLFKYLVDDYKAKSVYSDHADAAKAIIRFDILSRVLRLTDTVINGGNFGQVTKEDAVKWKLIDFKVSDLRKETASGKKMTYEAPDLIKGFNEGRGTSGSYHDGMMKAVLRPEDADLKAKKRAFAKSIIDELGGGRLSHGGTKRKETFVAAVKKAYDQIVVYLGKNAEILGINEKVVLADLAMYCTNVKSNFSVFETEFAGDVDLGAVGAAGC